MTSATAIHEQPRPTVCVWLSLAAIVLLGLALRLTSFRDSLWLDELHTAWIVSGDFGQVAQRATIGNQSPAFYWLLWPYARTFGVNEWSLRLPSLLASVLSIVAVFALARRWTSSSSAGLVAAIALALEAHSALFYASEARVYAMVQLVALLQLLALSDVLRVASLRNRAIVASLSWTLFYLHYTTALLLFAEMLAMLLPCLWRRRTDYSLKRLAMDAAIFMLGCSPAWPHLHEIYQRRENWAMFIPHAGWQEWLNILPHGQALVAIVLMWAVVAMTCWRMKMPLRAVLEYVVFALAWLLLPLYLAWQLTELDVARLFFLRYLVYVLPAGGVLVAILGASLPKRIAIAFSAAAVVLLAGWNLWINYPVLTNESPIRNENWREAIATLNERNWRAGEPLFVAAGLVEAEGLRTSNDAHLREYCLFPLHAAYSFQAGGIREEPLPFRSPGRLSKPHVELADAWLAKHDSVLFLIRGTKDHARQAAADVEQSLQRKAVCGDFDGFGDLWLFTARRTQ